MVISLAALFLVNVGQLLKKRISGVIFTELKWAQLTAFSLGYLLSLRR